MTRLLAFALIPLLSGCASVPGTGGGSLTLGNGRQAFYGFRGHDLHFLIVTDGNIASANASDLPLLGSRWSGKIGPVNGDQKAIAFKACQDNIHIGGKKHRLGDGQAFAVSTKHGAPEIRQIMITPRAQIENLIRVDKRFDF